MIYEFAATQDLHGYEKPWPPGGWTNLLQLTGRKVITSAAFTNTTPRDFSEPSVYVGITGGNYFNNSYIGAYAISDDVVKVKALSNGYGVGLTVPCTPETTYTLSYKNKEAGTIKIGFYASDGSYISGWDIDAAYKWTFTTPEDCTNLMVVFSPPKDVEYTFSEPQLELGSSATSYVPYANICMPEGFNIWDPTNQEYIQVYAGYVNANTRELYLRPVYKEYAGEELVGPWMSSLDEYSEDATPTEGAFVIDFGGELESLEITPFMLQTLLDSLGIRQHFTNGAGLLNSLMDQAQGRVRSEEELLHLSRPLNVIAIGDQLPVGLTFKPISKDVLPGLPGKFIR